MLILQQDHRTASCFMGQHPMFGTGIPTVGFRLIHIRMLEQSQAELRLQDLTDSPVQGFLGNQATPASLQERLMFIICRLEDDIQAVIHSRSTRFFPAINRMMQLMNNADGISIRYGKTIESPFFTQLLNRQP